ncbi:Grc3p [Sugiyamaella lignohabitans]|uniref:Polynucleotide 5'-hydroxyl-kinase GRC3 n=1 Tax=Sugiyamaella lignohabitans TaxID=796027 RepID=A0A167D3C0_9ASCO|nr:Grc3p [Sugiyamaella lignohabitans]ANB12430.1 Grc3p [Sugiyamaella lignohabitans]
MKRKSAVSALLATRKNKNIKLDDTASSTASPSEGSEPSELANPDVSVIELEDNSNIEDENGLNQQSTDVAVEATVVIDENDVNAGNEEDEEIDDEVEFASFPPSGLSSRQRSKSIEAAVEFPEDFITVSTFKQNSHNTVKLTTGSEVYGMVKGETLAFNGEYQLTIQKGAVRIMGAILHASKRSYHISSPCNGTHALPVIECVQVENLELVEQTTTDYNEQLIDSYRAVIKVESAPTGLRNVVNLAPNFKNLWGLSEGPNEDSQTDLEDDKEEIPLFEDDEVKSISTGSTTPAKPSFQIIYRAPASIALFKPFRSWYDMAAKTVALGFDNDPPKVLVLGPKSSGKSSFCRFLTNYFLASEINQCHYLELDPGQPEYCPPGTVSLHSPEFNFSPSFSHSNFRNSIRAHTIGSTSPKDHPNVYLSYCRDLYRTYEKTQVKSQSPLIINTPGWTRGLGVDLLADITSIVQPNIIISLGPDDSQTEIRAVLSRRTDIPVTSLESVLSYNSNAYLSAPSSAAKYSASELRVLQTLTYFHSASSPIHSLKFNSTHLTETVPYSVPYGEESSSNPLAIQGIAITASEGINPEDVSLCVNGAVVAVISVDHETSPIPIQRTPDESLPYIDPNDLQSVLIPDTCKCLGYAVVQSIDVADNTIRLLTPIPPSVISQNDRQKLVLLRGRLQLPLWELWNPSLDDASSPAPYLSKSGPGSAPGSHRWRVRRNVLRRGYA